MRGSSRALKIGLALTLVVPVVNTALSFGALAVLKFVFMMFAAIVVLNQLVMRGWRVLRQRRVEPLQPGVWPPIFESRRDDWTRDFAALGFALRGDLQAPWRLGVDDRKTALRYFLHERDSLAACIHANREPKSVGRTLQSKLADGRFLVTSDRTSNFETLPDSRIVVCRGQASDSSARLVELHERAIADLGMATLPIADPAQAAAEAHNAWAAAALASGHTRADGEWLALTPAFIFRLTLRTFAQWFR